MELESLMLAMLLFVSIYYVFCLLNTISPKLKSDNVTKLGLQLPPGSTGWPIIGETLEYLRTAKQGVPEKFIADRRSKNSSSSSSCKVFMTSLLGEPMAVMCTAEGNKFLFSNENKLVRSWWPAIKDKIFPSSGKKDSSHETIGLRRILTPYLKPDALQRYIGVMDEVTKQHLDMYWSSSSASSSASSVDFVKKEDGKVIIKVHPLAKKHIFALGCKLFLNIEDLEILSKLEKPIQQISAGFFALPINFPGTIFNQAIGASKKIRKELEEMVRQRRTDFHHNASGNTQHHDDVMSKLLKETYSDGDELTLDSDIANMLCALMIGAHDAPSSTVCTIILFLSHLPHVYDAVLTEQMEIAKSKAQGELLNWDDLQKMKYSWSVVCEAMRLLPPGFGTFREAITDFEYEGYKIPKGMKLHWNMFATHKNPEYFPDPEKFDPTRFQGQGPTPYSYVPFGGGPRMCPGKEYTRFMILVFMHNVVTRFKWEMVFPEEKMIMDPLLVPTNGLTIRLFPLQASSS